MIQKDIYYHGTDNFLPTGTVMTGRGSAYAEDWKTLGEAYDILEERRPLHLIAHRNAVFMCSVDVENGDRRLVMQGISTDADYQMQGMARKLVEHASKLALASEMPLVPSRYSHDGELYIRPIMDALTHKKAMTGNENHLAQGL